MCGIAGSLGAVVAGPSTMADAVHRMVASLTHRGPDDAGVWADPSAAVCLGNRRLAVVDLSTAGHQPMHSASGRYVVTLNGEIYNHEALRTRLALEGHAPAWVGTSDTEVLTAALEAWGIAATLVACVGMFAIAVWDREERRLTLARDRIGEKPLFFGRFRGTWLFGSEMKALMAHPHFTKQIDREAFATYMSLGYVPAPSSIFAGVRKVMPGTMVTIAAQGSERQENVYWSAIAVAAGPRRAFADDKEAIDTLEGLLSNAVSQQMVADRPVGALLSGGVDSSTIVALMNTHRSAAIRTFSIGFQQSSFNEALFAARVAAHFQTEHTELYVDANDVRDTIPLLPQIYDEPFADISQIPTFLVSRLASSHVTVALTGDGGDELFGGYPRYSMAARLWPAMNQVPRAWRPAIAGLLRQTPDALDRAFSWAFPHDEESGVRGLRPAQKLNKLGRAIRSDDIDALYWQLLAPWAEPGLISHPLQGSAFPPALAAAPRASIEEDFMLRDLVGYLPDDILAKIDRASMAVSLESRAPLLDHHVVEFALQLPLDLKFRKGVGKWLLREVLYRHIPKELVDRPKMGFGIPIASWLRGPLKPWAHDLIASSRGDMAQMLDLRAMARMLDRHGSGVGDWHQPLWTGLMFLNWARQVDWQSGTVSHAAPVSSPDILDWSHSRMPT
ncbi:MAG: asparagine synthase (glutamine-hydrolyzing) [Burkholderiaceae bacterium]